MQPKITSCDMISKNFQSTAVFERPTPAIGDEDERNASLLQGFQALPRSGQDPLAPNKNAVYIERLIGSTNTIYTAGHRANILGYYLIGARGETS